MAREMDFRKPRLGEYTAASSLCLCQHPPEVSHCSRNRISVSSGKTSANVVMWKDKEYKYISSA